MDECRHGLVAAVCAVCCRAAEHVDTDPTVSVGSADASRELAVAGGAVPR